MKVHVTISLISFILALNIHAQQPADSAISCGFQYAVSDSLIIFGFGSYEIFTRADYRDESVYHKWTVSNGLESDERDPNFIISTSDSVVEICHKIVTNTGIVCERCEIIYHFPSIPPACNADYGFTKDTTVNFSSTYQFYDLSEGSNIVSWYWSFGDGETSTLQNPIHEYNDSGFFRINLQIETESGCMAEKTKYLIVRTIDNCQLNIGYKMLESDPPQYQFFCDVYDPRLIMSFRPPDTDSAWYDALRYHWDLGDGIYSMEPFVFHNYYKSGDYNVILQVVYADGFTCTSEINSYFKGRDHIVRCEFKGMFYRNYNGYGIDAIVMDGGNALHVKQILPKIYLPDSIFIRFGFQEAGDTLYIGDEIFPSVIINCLDMQSECEYTGTVKDFTGLDGCGFLIDLDNGTRLEPILTDTTFIFRDKQRVKLSYTERYDMASICMAGIIAEITCIEEIQPDTIVPPPYCEQVILNTSFTMNGGYCSGNASIDIFTPCSAWMYFEMIRNTNYQILWSTGETTPYVSGLCPGTLYFVNVTNPVSGKTYTSAFSIFMLQNLFPSWTFTKVENNYRFYLPVDSNYSVSWKFDNDIALNGNSASYTFTSGGNHQVQLEVKDINHNLVYTEIIQLSVPTNILQSAYTEPEIYPNPVSDHLYIKLPKSLYENNSLKIYNSSGQFMNGKNITDVYDNRVDVSMLKQGLYILVISGNDISYTIKFQKR